MNERDYDEINRFLASVGRGTLFEYLDLSEDGSAGEAEQAIKARRTWAQSQQANPKYRVEALWIIKNQRVLRDALIDERESYLERVRSRDQERAIEVLSLFIRGTLAGGSLTRTGMAAILEQSRNLGLDEDVARARIEDLAREHGAAEAIEEVDRDFVDHYAALEVSPSASAAEIDQAYRARYRWARTLADTQRSRNEYARLDAALRDLRDPERRAAYDERYRAAKGVAAQAEPQAFLPPPPDDLVSQNSSGNSDPHSDSSLPGSARLVPARTERAETTEPPGTAPPVRNGGAPSAPDETGESPAATVPRPPLRLTGKTLSLASPREGTRLELDTPSQIQVAVGHRPTVLHIKAHQVGGGTVSGRVLADRDWVTVEPGRLEPGVTDHVITVRIHPERMQRPHGSSIITIVPSHGPRLSVTLDVGHRPRPTRLLIGGAILIGLTGLCALALPFLPAGLPLHERSLRVDPDPNTALVYIGDHLIGPGSHTIHGSALPEGPVELQVRLDGFTPFTQTVELAPGQTVALRPRLELSKPLDFRPARGQDGKPVPQDQIDKALHDNQRRLAQCLPEATEDGPAAVTLQAYVGIGGQVEGLEFEEPTDVSDDERVCVSRILRAQSFALGDPADYWFFEATIHGRPAGKATPP